MLDDKKQGAAKGKMHGFWISPYRNECKGCQEKSNYLKTVVFS